MSEENDVQHAQQMGILSFFLSKIDPGCAEMLEPRNHSLASVLDNADDALAPSEKPDQITFPLRSCGGRGRTIELVEFDHNPTYEEVCAEFAHRGLEITDSKQSEIFGLEYTETLKKYPVAFLASSSNDYRGDRYVLVVRKATNCIIPATIETVFFNHLYPRPFVFAAIQSEVKV